MFVYYRTEGIIIKKEDRGEADQLFLIYTKDFGRLEILGKAIRKISSKLRAGIDVFYLSEVEFIQGKVQKTLTDATLIKRFDNLKKDLNKLKAAQEISAILDYLLRGQEPDIKVWQLINETLNGLDGLKLKNDNWKTEIIYYRFFWNLLAFLGYGIELYHCAFCQNKLQAGKNYLNKKENGIVCPSCFGRTKTGVEITPETIKVLRIILKKNLQALLKLKIEAKYLKELSLISKKNY